MKSTVSQAVLVGRLPVAMLIVTAAALASAFPAHAALGGDDRSVEADRVSMKGEARVTSINGYEVREITTPAGTRVREYLSAGGQVFALSWQGPVQPDLRSMLGSYYGRYAEAVKAPHAGGHRHLTVELPGLVVQSNGRMRAFYGRAWDPTLLPPNFSADEIS
jgi:hypothetical protein